MDVCCQIYEKGTEKRLIFFEHGRIKQPLMTIALYELEIILKEVGYEIMTIP